jgi:hypothetical protein
MRKAFLVAFIGMFLGLMLIGCQRGRGVDARNEEYQPRPAPLDRSNPLEHRLSQDLQGELTRVDLANKTFVVRVENGMEQTFKFDNDTTVLGLSIEPQPVQPGKRQKPSATTNEGIRNLVGKEGSEVIVQWRTEDGAKMASRVDVTQPSTSKSKRRHK